VHDHVVDRLLQRPFGAIGDVLDDHRVIQVPVTERLRIFHVEDAAAPGRQDRCRHETAKLSEANHGRHG
jgi:hypothetical protein